MIVAGDYHQDSFQGRIEDENDIVKDIEREIIMLTESTKESIRKENVESYEKIFIRLAATGGQTLGGTCCMLPPRLCSRGMVMKRMLKMKDSNEGYHCQTY